MKAVKTLSQGLLLAHYGQRGRQYLAVTGLLAFRLTDPSERVPEPLMWKSIAPELGTSVLDEGPPKPVGEFLVAGSACLSTNRDPRQGEVVEATVAGRTRRLAVFGDRRWKSTFQGMIPSDPAPMEKVPLSWERAYGGPGWEANPLGVGFVPAGKPTPGALLPNVEDPAHLVASVDDRPVSSTFLPMGATHPERTPLHGTYDDHWIKKVWPYFPDDLDFRFFLVGHRDQRLDGFFTGAETIRLKGMNALHPELVSHLPDRVMRLFVNQVPKEEMSKPAKQRQARFIELEPRLDTLWLFPTVDIGVTLWRAVVSVHDDEATDVVNVYLADEGRDGKDRLTFDQHKARFAEGLTRALDVDMGKVDAAKADIEKAKLKAAAAKVKGEELKKKAAAMRAEAQPKLDAAKQLLKDGTVPPMGNAGKSASAVAAAGAQSLMAMADKVAALKAKYPDKVKADPAAIKAAAAKLEKLPAKLSSIAAEKEAAKAKAKETLIAKLGPDKAAKVLSEAAKPKPPITNMKQIKAMGEVEKKKGLEQAAAQLKKQGLDPAKLLKPKPPAGDMFTPPPLSAEAKAALPPGDLARVEAAHKRATELLANAKRAIDAAKAKGDALKGMAADVKAGAKGSLAKAMALRDKHFLDAPMTRERFLALVAGGASFAGVSIKGLDLSGADLTGADLSGIVLQESDLSGADLTGANIKGAKLIDITMPKAKLTGAEAGKAVFMKGDQSGVDFSMMQGEKAVFQENKLAETSFVGATLNGTIFNKADLTAATFDKASMDKGAFLSAKGGGASFVGASFRKSAFLKSDLTNADHTGANHDATAFVESILDGNKFVGAKMDRSKGIRGSSFVGADFSGVSQVAGSYMQCDMTKATFTNATLTAALISDSNLTDATLNGLLAKGTRIEKSILTGVTMKKLDLMGGSLRKSKLDKTDCTGASFFGADFFGAGVYDTTYTKDANLTGVRFPERVKDEDR